MVGKAKSSTRAKWRFTRRECSSALEKRLTRADILREEMLRQQSQVFEFADLSGILPRRVQIETSYA